MSVRAIEAEVSIKSGVSAECTIGREVIVEVHDDVTLDSLTVTANGQYAPSQGVDGFSDVTVAVPERVPVTESLSVTENGTYEPNTGVDGYDRVEVNVPIITPEIEPLTVTANGVYTASGDGFNPVTVNVPIPTDPNVCEGEFIGTEVGTLRVNIPYDGDTFPKMIIVYVDGECLSTTGDFIVNANLYAINVCQLLKMYATTPSYNGNSNPNFARLVVSYKGSNSGYSQSALSGYNYNQGSCNYNADCLKFRDNKTMDVFIQTERNPTTGGIFFMKDIRYKYKVFY